MPGDGLVLASAERADLLVDFSDLQAGTELTLVNTARAPFDGSPSGAGGADPGADPDALLVFPQVMRFRVVAGEATRRPIPNELAADYRPPSSSELVDAPRRAILLVEREVEGEPNMLTLRELAPAGENDPGPAVTVTESGQTDRYRVAASHFEDATTFFPMLGQYEPFQILSRRPIRHEVPEDGIEDFEIAASVTLGRGPADELDHAIDDNERGLKDTIRVNPNEIVEIAVRFTTYAGRYMYHCHILEHEDRDMMRPFVTMPEELMPFMG